MVRFVDMPGGEATSFGNTDRMLIEPAAGTTKWFDYERLADALDARRAVGCLVSEAGGPQTITTATWTDITFDTDEFDYGGCHDTGSNTERITIPSGEKGIWIFGGSIGWAADAGSAGVRQIRLYKNGSGILINTQTIDNPGTSNLRHHIGSTPFLLDAADYVTLQGYQTSGGNLNTVESNTTFWALQLIKIP
jgi:hypothetical protein